MLKTQPIPEQDESFIWMTLFENLFMSVTLTYPFYIDEGLSTGKVVYFFISN